MTWRSGKGDWERQPVPENECNFYRLLEGLTGSDAPTGHWSFIMAGIIRYCNLKTVVELGVWKGGTTVCLADAVRDTGGTVWAVDQDDCWEARDRLKRLGLESPHCIFVKWTTWECTHIAGAFANPLDLLFIDAGHSLHDITRDWQAWAPLVKPGGWIFVDNTTSEPGVREFFTKFFDGTVFFKTGYGVDSFDSIICPESFGMGIFRKKIR